MSTVRLEPVQRSLAGRTWSGVRRDPLLVLAACVCALMVLVVLVGPLLAPYPPDQTDILAANQGASSAHWLGTDALGRDTTSRLARSFAFGAYFGMKRSPSLLTR